MTLPFHNPQPFKPQEVHMSISPFDVGRTGLLDIDMRNDFVEGAPLESPEGRRLIPAVQKVPEAARVDGERGVEIHPSLAPRPGESVIKKRRFNSLRDLEIILRGLGVETGFLTGMTTECCVLGAARGALERGFRSEVISEGCVSCDCPDLGTGPRSAEEMNLPALRVMSLTSSQLADTHESLARLP
ncbi:nicotinamidase-related amidase [Streptomyces sp. SAI-117]|uniref:cysteine hydrolase family protein n=2 Tax=Streptomyces TaxID=1883 RepID=UPI002473D4EE|nr:isochorismatase family cysteine hydrolase [Streptomyces sp. SAI-117]MDH6573607.1 nicotinamidase-related amidase [Streptomyces sp. SAI-117]